MKYKFTATAPDGTIQRGEVDAGDRYEALAQIREEERVVKKLVPVMKVSELLSMEIGPGQLNIRVLLVLCEQLSMILRSGISVIESILLLSRQSTNRKLRKILNETGRLVEAGNSLAGSFYLADKNAFPVTFLEMVRAGERSGRLSEVFHNLSIYYEKRYKTKQKVSAAMTYPGFVLAIALFVIGIVMVMVVPTVTGVLVELGAELPLPTRVLIGISAFIRDFLLELVMLLLGFVLILLCYLRTEKGRMRYDREMLKMPVVGNLRILEASGQFAHTLSVMLQSGLNLIQALHVTARTLDNYHLASAVIRIAGNVVEGSRLGDCMRREACFPEALTEVCAMGEETGELEELLSSMGEFFDSELEFSSKRALTMLEPCLLVVLAIFTGFVVISIYLPMFTMYDLM